MSSGLDPSNTRYAHSLSYAVPGGPPPVAVFRGNPRWWRVKAVKAKCPQNAG